MKQKTEKHTSDTDKSSRFDSKLRFNGLNFWFQDPNKPIQSCNLNNCKNCSLSGQLNCHFNIKQLILFYSIIIPVFALGAYVIFEYQWLVLLAWIVYMILFFGLVEIRVMCSHCPHYGQKGSYTLKCWANYGAPKIWKYRPGPMTHIEKTVFLLGFAILFSFPIIPALILKYYVLLAVYIIFLILWKWLLKQNYCTHCYNFACPFNNTDKKLKNQFLEQNPSIKKVWNKKKK
jgi:hypothetical protein